MKRRLKYLLTIVILSVMIFAAGCTTEHYAYAGPYHKVVVVRHHPPKIYRVKVHRHKTIYYYPAGVYYPKNN